MRGVTALPAEIGGMLQICRGSLDEVLMGTLGRTAVAAAMRGHEGEEGGRSGEVFSVTKTGKKSNNKET